METQRKRKPSSLGCLGSGLLLLLLEECKQRASRYLGDLETDTWDISDSATATSETRNDNFVVLINEVHATIHGNEGGDFLAVLDELYANTLTQG